MPHHHRLMILGEHSDALPHFSAMLSKPDFDLLVVADIDAAVAALAGDDQIELVVLVSACCTLLPQSMLTFLRDRTDAGILLISDCADGGACALERGADDWVPTTVHSRELRARLHNLSDKVRAVRVGGGRDGKIIRFAGWQLDCGRRELTDPTGATTRLTGVESTLLAALVVNAGRPLAREWLLEHISSRDLGPASRSIDMAIAQLRRKLGDHPRQPRFIMTMHGVGYRFAG